MDECKPLLPGLIVSKKTLTVDENGLSAGAYTRPSLSST